MVKRFTWKRYAYLVFALLILLASWEANRSNAMLYAASAASAAAGTEEEGPEIPKESIRLRILANSDAPQDQWVKRQVRDAIIEQMKAWVTEPQGIEAARATVREHLPELDKLVGATLRNYGFDYDYKVELGVVPFPTKMYGNRVYPAGDYEALRVSIGKAEGQNWWCVLFPPLCFVDSEMIAKKNTAYAEPAAESASGEAKASKAGDKAAGAGNGKGLEQGGKSSGTGKAESKGSAAKTEGKNKDASVKAAEAGQGRAAEAGAKTAEAAKAAAVPQPEIHFFLWDLLKQIGSWFV